MVCASRKKYVGSWFFPHSLSLPAPRKRCCMRCACTHSGVSVPERRQCAAYYPAISHDCVRSFTLPLIPTLSHTSRTSTQRNATQTRADSHPTYPHRTKPQSTNLSSSIPAFTVCVYQPLRRPATTTTTTRSSPKCC